MAKATATTGLTDAEWDRILENHRNSEAAMFSAQAENFKAEAAVERIALEHDELRLSQAREKESFDKTQDYHHCYVSFDDDITPPNCGLLAGTLRRLDRLFPGKPMTLELNSPGGDITSGLSLFDEIRRVSGLGHEITIRVRGQAASMAAVILQAADIREAGPSSFIMLHRAAFGVRGKTFEVEDAVEEAKMNEHRIFAILAERTGKSAEYWDKTLGKRKDVWYTPQQALEAGLIDGIK